MEKERSYYVFDWDVTTIYWPPGGEKIEGKLASGEYFGVRVRVSDSKKSDGAYEYDLGRWAVKRDVVQVGGCGDFPYTVSLNGRAKEFSAEVSAVKAEMKACYHD